MEDDRITEETNYSRVFARGSTITFVGLILVSVSQLLLRIFLARGLSEAMFGLLFSVFTFFSLLNVFSHLGLNQAITKFVSGYNADNEPEKIRTSIFSSLTTVIGASLLVSSLVIVLSGFLSSYYFESPRAIPLLIILSVWFFFMSFHHFFTSVFQGFKDFSGRTLMRMVRNFTPFLLVIPTIYFFDLTLNRAAVFYLLGPVFSTVGGYWLLRRRRPNAVSIFPFPLSRPMLKEMLAFGVPLILAGFAGTLIGKIDTVLLTGLRSLRDVGFYQAAILAKPMLTFLSTSMAVPLFPIISELWTKEEIDPLREIISRLTKYTLVLSVPVALLFFAFPEEIIRIVYGSRYLAAANALRILAIATVFWGIESVFGGSLKGIGESSLVLKSTGSAAAANILVDLWLIPSYGATGAAAGSGVAFLVGLSVSFYYSKRKLKFSLPYRSLGKTVLGGMMILALAILLKNYLPLSLWLKIGSISLLCILIYFFWIFGTRIITEKDLDILESAVFVPDRIDSLLRRMCRT
ncbi:hypothetical protein AKJ38_01730 [candidate division MSBL1 archaeon SCGC-AAA259I14]|uniref:Uncharacterized protein n=1 Tax=candidate division MSBL1 archaeon SCGC-AAA259I14 TaxID=1698268 RepID=A0A133UST0_9EURY|nr:hypothetical protein AKJ38_01730 [candidate division MSBL1 archaeon SCGC-AAA259I14]